MEFLIWWEGKLRDRNFPQYFFHNLVELPEEIPGGCNADHSDAVSF